MGNDLEGAAQIAKLVLQFGRTNRVTLHEDGVTPESDTDHTVMLGVIACALASKEAPHLDVGTIAKYALVHDLVEAYAGDTNTFGGLTDSGAHEKEEREKAALMRIQEELKDTFPWVYETIVEYESLATPEARFVKTLDKVMPKITHALNGGAYFSDAASFDTHCAIQRDKIMSSYGADQPEAMVLYDQSVAYMRAVLEKRFGSTEAASSQEA